MPVLQITYISTNDTAKLKGSKITGVSSTGVLSYNGGISIQMSEEITKKRRPGIPEDCRAKYIPSYIPSPFNKMERADIGAAVYTGSGWIVEYRHCKTLTLKPNFFSLDDQRIRFAVWDEIKLPTCNSTEFGFKISKVIAG